MRYISEKVLNAEGVFRDKDGRPLPGDREDVLVRPSDLLATVKKPHDVFKRRRHYNPQQNNDGGEQHRCTCKHHQQRYMRERLEEQRRRLKRRLAEAGDLRHLEAINRHTKRAR